MKASTWVRGATVAVTVAVLAVLVWRVDPRRVVADFHGVRWIWVLATAVINLLNTAVEAVRWRLLARSVAPKVRWRSTFNGFLAGIVGNVVLPLRLGDGARAYVFAEAEGLPLATAISTVVLDRLLDVAAFGLLAILTVAVTPLPAAVARAIPWTVAGLGVLCAAVFAFITWDGRRTRGGGVPRTGWVATQVDRLRAGFSGLRTAPLGPAVAMAALSWTLKLALVWTMFRAFNLSLPPAAPAVLQVVVNLGIAVAGTPGNVGSFELASMAALALFGVGNNLAFSFGAALHVTEVLPMVALGLAMMWSGTFMLTSDRR
jgi:uncharacterized membrane protein YbhN (UPF0104 family)